jgi:hypothetical protein
MASITIINRTNAPINTSITFDGVNYSWKNRLDPGEFYVHSAAAGTRYTVKSRWYTGHESMYEANWGELIAEVVLDLAAVALTIVTDGAATPLLMTARAARLAAKGIGTIVDGVQKLNVKDIPREYEFPESVNGGDDVIFEALGHMDLQVAGGTATARPNALSMRKISQKTFAWLKRKDTIYELSEGGYPIRLDEHGQRYYVDPDGRTIYNPDGDEYYVGAHGKHVEVDRDARLTKVGLHGPENHVVASKQHISAPLVGNDRGEWKLWQYLKGPALGLELVEQAPRGIINARLLGPDGTVTGWGTGSLSNNLFPCRQGVAIVGVDVCEHHGYGIVDMRLITLSNTDSWDVEVGPWIARNPDTADLENKKIYIRRLRTRMPSGHPDHQMSVVIGIQVKEQIDWQGDFGLVDVRFAEAPLSIWTHHG